MADTPDRTDMPRTPKVTVPVSAAPSWLRDADLIIEALASTGRTDGT